MIPAHITSLPQPISTRPHHALRALVVTVIQASIEGPWMVPHLRVPGDIRTDAPTPVKADTGLLSGLKTAGTNTKWMSYAAYP